jgi:N-acetylglucosaminyl-diphospho-decaprenol L-rhamnosyltransferase
VLDLTIIIVSHNTRSDLEACLRSIDQHPPHITHEVIVVDNASRDGTVAAIAAGWPNVRIIPMDSNVGFAAANNAGFRKSQGELVLLLNSDTLVLDGSIDGLVHAIRELPGAAIVGPRLIDTKGMAELSFGRMMSPFAELRQKLLVRTGGARVAELTSQRSEVDWVSGACLLVRRASAESAGLLDERYFMYCEDVDFCAAVRAQGGRVYFVPEPRVVHLRGRSRATASVAVDAAYRESHLAFYRKHHPRWEPFLRLYMALKGKLPAAGADKKG